MPLQPLDALGETSQSEVPGVQPDMLEITAVAHLGEGYGVQEGRYADVGNAEAKEHQAGEALVELHAMKEVPSHPHVCQI